MAKRAPAPTTITRDDWLAALEEATAGRVDNDPSLLTYMDFAAMFGVAIGTARDRLRMLVSKGLAKRSTKRALTPDGKIRVVVAFRLEKK